MKFVCLGCIQEGNWDSLSEADGQRMLEECFPYDDERHKGGHFLGGDASGSENGAA